jgi:2-polyprenyl-6-hydroxyphenyl methylase/3-demethylubiquinone-9 3-methyltransferase
VTEYVYDTPGARFDDEYIVRPVMQAIEHCGAKRVLDIGCGNGALAARLADRGLTVTGIDTSASGIEVARTSVPRAQFAVQSVDGDLGVLAPESFDAAVSMEVIEHLFNPRALVRLAHRVLKPGGHLIVTTPYHGFLKNLALSVTNGWDKHLNPLWDGGHIKFFSRKTLTRLIADERFTVVSARGAGRLPGLWKSLVVVAKRSTTRT